MAWWHVIECQRGRLAVSEDLNTIPGTPEAVTGIQRGRLAVSEDLNNLAGRTAADLRLTQRGWLAVGEDLNPAGGR